MSDVRRVTQADLYDDNPGDDTTEDFAALLADHLSTPRRYRQGQQVAGEVVKVTPDWVFVSLDGKNEGVIDSIEFKDDDGNLKIEVGKRVDAYVVSTGRDDETIRLSRAMGRGAGQLEQLEQAFGAGIPVEGKITARNKGGYEVTLGSVRGFLPISHLDTRRVSEEDADKWVGQTHRFLITRIKGKDVVLSRRVLLEQEAAKQREAMKDQLKEGAVVNGKVRSLRDYGAFVEIVPGIEGLLHVSEMSWTRIDNPRDMLQEGQDVAVVILKYDAEAGKMSLGLKQLGGDPWLTADQQFRSGDTVTGKVVRLAPFGAFVSLAEGIDGLVHISNMSWAKRVSKPEDVVQLGDVVQVQVMDVDLANRRINLGLKQVSGDPWAGAEERYVQGTEVEGKVEKVEAFGVFVTLEVGIVGLIPNNELGNKPGSDNKRDFPPGSTIKAAVLEVDRGARRIRLSRKALTDNQDRSAYKAYTEAQPPRATNFGTLGDMLSKLKLGK